MEERACGSLKGRSGKWEGEEVEERKKEMERESGIGNKRTRGERTRDNGI